MKRLLNKHNNLLFYYFSLTILTHTQGPPDRCPPQRLVPHRFVRSSVDPAHTNQIIMLTFRPKNSDSKKMGFKLPSPTRFLNGKFHQKSLSESDFGVRQFLDKWFNG